jgi:tetratricopeptide (TPR) repeat protein
MLTGSLAASGHAQTTAYASANSDQAKQLAERALVVMRQGEDEPSIELKRKYYQEGQRLAEQSLELQEMSADAHFARFANMGRLLALSGAVPSPWNLWEINRELNRTLEIDPLYADAWAAKGGMYRQLPGFVGGSDKKAEQCLKKAIELDEHAVSARVELAELYREQGESHRGIPFVEQAIVIADQDGKPRQRDEAKVLLEMLRKPQ